MAYSRALSGGPASWRASSVYRGERKTTLSDPRNISLYFLLLLLTAACFLQGSSAWRNSVFMVLPQVEKSFRSRQEK